MISTVCYLIQRRDRPTCTGNLNMQISMGAVVGCVGPLGVALVVN
jgi:hypothetical protein